MEQVSKETVGLQGCIGGRWDARKAMKMQKKCEKMEKKAKFKMKRTTDHRRSCREAQEFAEMQEKVWEAAGMQEKSKTMKRKQNFK